jgi:hypothetical protein
MTWLKRTHRLMIHRRAGDDMGPGTLKQAVCGVRPAASMVRGCAMERGRGRR